LILPKFTEHDITPSTRPIVSLKRLLLPASNTHEHVSALVLCPLVLVVALCGLRCFFAMLTFPTFPTPKSPYPVRFQLLLKHNDSRVMDTIGAGNGGANSGMAAGIGVVKLAWLM
jgi:hypothetical protein